MGQAAETEARVTWIFHVNRGMSREEWCRVKLGRMSRLGRTMEGGDPKSSLDMALEQRQTAPLQSGVSSGRHEWLSLRKGKHVSIYPR